MKDNIQKSYYAIIPANVRYDTELNPSSKLLYGEITALCNQQGYCWANNSYFANLYGVTKGTISRWVSDLADKGYIRCEMKYKEGTNQIERRKIYIADPMLNNDDRCTQKETYPIRKNDYTPIRKNDKDNNTSINNTINNTREYSASKESTTDINDFFEKMWKLYPNKKNKGQVSKSKKKEIYKLGDEFERCIERYIKDVEEQRRNGFTTLRYKNGSTFFNSGYVDYLDENYQDTLDSNRVNKGGNNEYKGGITEDKTESGNEINFAELAGIKEF